VYQLLHLVPQASVLENVLMGALGRRGALGLALAPLRAAERAAVAAVLAEVGLDGRLHQRVDRLSGGEQQRVAVARVLYQGPEAIVADSPSFGGPGGPRPSWAGCGPRGQALVLSTHQLDPMLPPPPGGGLRADAYSDRHREDLTADDLGGLPAPGRQRLPDDRARSRVPSLLRAPVLVGPPPRPASTSCRAWRPPSRGATPRSTCASP
jgi:phosphonate transport system ATP-binding protein